MKKAYLYFLAPLVGVAAFGAVYWQYAAGFEAKLEAAQKKVQEERAEKARKENESKKVAVEQALAAQEARKKAKAEKDDREAKEKEAREIASQTRIKMREEVRKNQDRVRALQKDVEEGKAEVAKVEVEKKNAVAEEAFLRDYVKKAEATRVNYETVLKQIDAANKAMEANQKAAELAAKAAKK